VTVGSQPVAVLAGIVFVIGLFGVVYRRDGFGLVVSLAILLLASVIAFAGFSAAGGGAAGPPQGEVVALGVLVIVTAESLIGAALIALLRRRRETLEVDAYDAPDAETE
jgi:NADH-quinone oxidoreductase subunit K